jgi:hypothetical protein
MSLSPTLFGYLRQCQRFIHDQKQQQISPEDLAEYANRARREVAMRSQCVRILPPISGSIITGSITAAGAGYTSPTVTISAPDYPSGYGAYPNGAQATATATEVGGALHSFSVTFGGSGYFEPVVTINDPTGTGAAVTPNLSPMNVTVAGQEVYPFSNIPLINFPLVDSVIAVKSVSIIYANYRYSLPQYSFSVYQAKIRQYPFQYQYVPTFCTQYGQGNAGSLYMYPLPAQAYQVELDCFCQPADLTMANGNVEDVIPFPWADAVPYFMAYLAYSELQNLNSARTYLEQFTDFMHRYRAAASPGRASNVYGRWTVLLIAAGAAVQALLGHVFS